MSGAPDTFLAKSPEGLVAALEQREGKIAFSWRENARSFARVSSPDGDVFARYTEDVSDRRRLERETAIRSGVGNGGPLRTPPVLEAGPGWRIEQLVHAETWRGAAPVDAAAAAAAEIPAIDLPGQADPAPGRSVLFADVARIARAVIGPISVSDLRRARGELAGTDLPTVTCHRDFHPKNILLEAGGAWVIDWERADKGPLGLDLMRLWTSLAEPEDRDRVFDHAVEQVGEERRSSLERLLFGVAVAEASGLHAEKNPFDRDDATLARLLDLIPSLRPAD